MNWQPIESAPKDGLMMLLLVPAKKKTLAHTGYWAGTYWLTYNHEAAVARVEPTHWMDLPPHPLMGAS